MSRSSTSTHVAYSGFCFRYVLWAALCYCFCQIQEGSWHTPPCIDAQSFASDVPCSSLPIVLSIQIDQAVLFMQHSLCRSTIFYAVLYPWPALPSIQIDQAAVLFMQHRPCCMVQQLTEPVCCAALSTTCHMCTMLCQLTLTETMLPCLGLPSTSEPQHWRSEAMPRPSWTSRYWSLVVAGFLIPHIYIPMDFQVLITRSCWFSHTYTTCIC